MSIIRYFTCERALTVPPCARARAPHHRHRPPFLVLYHVTVFSPPTPLAPPLPLRLDAPMNQRRLGLDATCAVCFRANRDVDVRRLVSGRRLRVSLLALLLDGTCGEAKSSELAQELARLEPLFPFSRCSCSYRLCKPQDHRTPSACGARRWSGDATTPLTPYESQLMRGKERGAAVNGARCTAHGIAEDPRARYDLR